MRWALAAAVLLSGCDTGGGGAPDAGADVGPDSGLEVEPPEEPAPPAPLGATLLSPCPEGWREVEAPGGLGLVRCEPWPDGGPVDCEGAAAHFPGEAGCATLGGPCPTGEWAEDLPAGAPVLHVRAGAVAGGDGSRERPFGTIAEATATAGPGAVVALARGAYSEAVRLGPGVALVGACAAGTVVACAEAAEEEATVTVEGRDVTVRGLTITGARPGLIATEGASVVVEDLLVDRALRWGLVLLGGAEGRLDRVVVRGVGPLPSTEGRGRAFAMVGGATATASGLVLERNDSVAMLIAGAGTTLTLEASAVRETRPTATAGEQGLGLYVDEGAVVTVRATAFESNRAYGVVSRDHGTEVRLEDVVVRGTRGLSGQGVGLDVHEGGALVASRLYVADNQGAGLWAAGAGSRVEVSHLLVEGTVPDASGINGNALQLTDGVEVVVDHAVLHGSREAGVLAERGARVSLSDLAVLATESQQSTGHFGRGIDASTGALVRVRRALLAWNRDCGAIAGDPGTTLELADAVVSETRLSVLAWPIGPDGAGVLADRGSEVTVERSVVERAAGCGAFAFGEGTVLRLEDVAISETGGDGQPWGAGLAAEGTARVEARRLVVDRSLAAGVFAFGAETSVSLEDAVVRGTRVVDRPGGAVGGMGIVSLAAAHVEVTRFLVSGNEACGVQLAHGYEETERAARGGAMDLHLGEVSGSPVGANVQTEGFDLTRLADRVVFRDNGRDLDMETLPPPDIGSPREP